MTLTRGLIIAIFVAFVSARSSPTVAAAVLPQQSGQPSVRVGDCLPAVALAATNGTTVLLTDLVGRVKLISVVPQLNTPVCDEQRIASASNTTASIGASRS